MHIRYSAILVAVLLVSCSGPFRGSLSPADQFEARARAFAHSTEPHDADVVTAFFEDSVFVVSPQGRRPVVGREANREAWARFFQAENPTHSMTVEVTKAAGDLAFSRGRWTVGMDTPKGRAEAAGTYLAVWQRNGSEWRIVELSVFTTR